MEVLGCRLYKLHSSSACRHNGPQLALPDSIFIFTSIPSWLIQLGRYYNYMVDLYYLITILSMVFILYHICFPHPHLGCFNLHHWFALIIPCANTGCVGTLYVFQSPSVGSLSSPSSALLLIKIISSKVIVQDIYHSHGNGHVQCVTVLLQSQLIKVFGIVSRASIRIRTTLSLVHCTCSSSSSCKSWLYFLIPWRLWSK